MALASYAAGAMARSSVNALLPAMHRFFSATSLDEKITVEVIPFRTHRIDAPSNVVDTSLGELLNMYELMKTMRNMEIAADLAYKAKMIRGFCHLYDGQEAICVGMEHAITRNDSIVTSYRDHCQHVARGGTVKEVLAELFGRKTGATRGLGGSMHMYNKAANFYGGNGIVGAQVPLGAGIALAHKYKKDGSVAFAMYGDGAANQGQVFEAFNIAGLWSLPVIFVCENNHYGMGTAEWRAARSTSFFARGDYIPGIKADGMDVLAVKQACAFAKEYVLANGPIILEMDTYRYHGHSMSDPGSTYRDRSEISSVRQERDPIERVKKLLLSLGYDANELKKKDKAIKATVDAAVNDAKNDEAPPLEWLWKNVYVDPKGSLLRTASGTLRTVEYDPTFTK